MDDAHHGPGRYGLEDRSGAPRCQTLACDAVVIDPFPEWHSEHGRITGYCPACEAKLFRRTYNRKKEN